MKTELENSKIITGFSTPTDYFDTLSDRLIEKLDGELHLEYLPKTSGFVVPENYFAANETKILQRTTQTKVIRLKSSFYKVTSIAAVLLLTIVSPILYNSIESKNNELAEISYLEMHAEELSIYEVGSMLDSEDLSELENELIYNDLSILN